MTGLLSKDVPEVDHGKGVLARVRRLEIREP
jgi:hypothetical protein